MKMEEGIMVKTLIYCASGAGERVAYSLDEMEYKIVGLVDSNPETWGKALYGLGGYCHQQKYVRLITI